MALPLLVAAVGLNLVSACADRSLHGSLAPLVVRSQVANPNECAFLEPVALFLTLAVADRAGEQQRLDKEIARIETEVRVVENKLQNESFVDRAPTAVVEEHRRRLKDFSAQLEKLKQARESLN